MDPNTCYANVMRLAEELADIKDPDEATIEELRAFAFKASELAEAICNLDGWIAKGGFLPTDWQRK